MTRRKQRSSSRQRQQRRAGGPPLRLAAAAVGVLGALAILVVVVEKAAHPYWLGHKVGREVAALEKKLDAQNARNKALRARIHYLCSPEGVETIARQKGYRRPGEQVFFLPETAAAAAAADASIPSVEAGRP